MNVIVDVSPNVFEYNMTVNDAPLSLYEKMRKRWVENNSEQEIRDAVRNGWITIIQYERITGMDY